MLKTTVHTHTAAQLKPLKEALIPDVTDLNLSYHMQSSPLQFFILIFGWQGHQAKQFFLAEMEIFTVPLAGIQPIFKYLEREITPLDTPQTNQRCFYTAATAASWSMSLVP